MDVASTALQNLLSPIILFFLLGIVAGVLKSSLTIPETLSKSVALYLMMAIGFRGGAELSHNGFDSSIVAAVLAAMALSALLPILAYALLRWTTRLDVTNAAAVAAHYGSVSVVTFAAAIALLTIQGVPFEPYIVALLAVMEAPAILTGLSLARRGTHGAQPRGLQDSLARTVVREVLLHGSVVLLLGSFAIGWATGSKGLEELGPVFVEPFKGVLCVFLLDMGLVVARRRSDLRAVSIGMAAFGLYMPLLGAAAGMAVALLLGLSVGGATLLAVLGASASYIVVPAVMHVALPDASPAIYLTLALGITFPFNLVVGIPLYHSAARALVSESADHAAAEPATLVIAFQPQEDTARLAPNADALAHFIGEKTGLPTKVFLPADYVAVVEALRGKHADVAYFSAWPYALATELAGAEIFAAERRSGETHYWSHWYVRADSPYQTLADLKGKPIAFTSPTSTSGWLFPLAKLIEEGVVVKGADPKSVFSEVLFAGGYEQALKALVAGQVEAAAASDYAPARFLSVEQRAGVRVLAKQGPVPTHVLAWRKDLPQATKEKIRAAFLALNEPANKELLMNTYGSEALVAVDESHVLPLQKALDATGRGTALSTFKK